jgi:DNA-binding response OmpR family regulator
MKYKILIVEDNKDLQLALREALLESDYSVDSVYEGAKALRQVEEATPDLVILDLGLPDISGETVCKELRKYFTELPIIILTAKDTTADIVRGFSFGANDYIAKPFEIEELLARIKARLHQSNSQVLLKVADLQLDTKKIQVTRSGKLIKLTQTEFLLLEYLMRNRDRVLSREVILDRVWSYTSDVETRVVDVYVGYLRKKIDSDYSKKLIHSVRGFGYVIKG